MVQSGHGEKLSRLQWRAVCAILDANTLAEAARQVGVSHRTLKNWLLRPEFREEIKVARQRVFEDGLSRLEGACNRAVNTLCRAMESGDPAVEVRAATAVLQLGLKATEQFDLAERIAALEYGAGPRLARAVWWEKSPMTLKSRIRRLESFATGRGGRVIEELDAVAAERVLNHPEGEAIHLELLTIAFQQGFQDLIDLRQKMLGNPRACELMARLAEIGGGLP
jgi:hypothetical protein